MNNIVYHNLSEQGGIYRILNTANGRIYYGSTSCFRKRIKSHLRDLMADEHLNKFMQNDYNKCGNEVFLFEVVEQVEGDKEARLAREQFYIDQVYDNQKNCYNLVKQAKDNRGGTRNKEAPDPLTDGRCKSPTEEVKAKRTAGIVEAYKSPTLIEASRERAYKKWEGHSAGITVTHRDTQESVVINGSVRQFCLDRGLSYKAFNQLVTGKIKSSGGWYMGTVEPEYLERKGEVRSPLSAEHRAKIAGNKFKGIKLVNGNGEELVIEANVKEQCRTLGLSYTTLLKVIKGTCKSVNGWFYPTAT